MFYDMGNMLVTRSRWAIGAANWERLRERLLELQRCRLSSLGEINPTKQVNPHTARMEIHEKPDLGGA